MSLINSDDDIREELTKFWGTAWSKFTPERRRILVEIWKQIEEEVRVRPLKLR